MWLYWFLTCCLAVRQEEDKGSAKAVKKKLHKYKAEDLRRELKALGVNLDEDRDGKGNKKKSGKKTQRELRKLLIRELKMIELDRLRKETCPRATNEVEELEQDGQQREDDVKAVL